MTVAAVVRRPGYRDLLVGQGVSALGDWMGTVAFMALVLQITGSPAAVGGILALRLLPAAVGGPLAARAASRWDRRRTMLAMDAARGAMIALVPLVRGLWWIYLWAFLVEVASIVFLPARDASIPDLVEEEELPVANGLILGSSYGSIPLGAALFALVAALPGAGIAGRPLALVFWLDAATFAVSFLLIARVTQLGSASGEAPATDQPTSFRAAFRIPLVRAVMPAAAAVALGLGALFSLGIVFVREVLGAGDAEFGLLIALFGVGAVAGLALLQRAPDGGDLLVRARSGVLAIGVIVASFSLAPSVGFAFLGAVGFGAAAAYTLASGMGAIQSRLDGTERVLAFAAFHVVIRVVLAVAAVGAGAVGASSPRSGGRSSGPSSRPVWSFSVRDSWSCSAPSRSPPGRATTPRIRRSPPTVTDRRIPAASNQEERPHERRRRHRQRRGSAGCPRGRERHHRRSHVAHDRGPAGSGR